MLTCSCRRSTAARATIRNLSSWQPALLPRGTPQTSRWSWIIMKCDCLWPWKCPWIHLLPCENNPNITSVSLIAFFLSQWRVSALLPVTSLTAQADLVRWLSLGASGMICPPAPSLHFSSPGKNHHKYLLKTATSTQEMFKKHDAYNRENNGVIHLIPQMLVLTLMLIQTLM